MSEGAIILSEIDLVASRYFDPQSDDFESQTLYNKLWSLLFEWEEIQREKPSGKKSNTPLEDLMIKLPNRDYCSHDTFFSTIEELVCEKKYDFSRGVKFSTFFISKAHYKEIDSKRDAIARKKAENPSFQEEPDVLPLRYNSVASASDGRIRMVDEDDSYTSDTDSEYGFEVGALDDPITEKKPLWVQISTFFSELIKAGIIDVVSRVIYSKRLIDASRSGVDGGEEEYSDDIFSPADLGFITKMTTYIISSHHSYSRLQFSDYSDYAISNDLVFKSNNTLKDNSIIEYLKPVSPITKGTLSKKIDKVNSFISEALQNA